MKTTRLLIVMFSVFLLNGFLYAENTDPEIFIKRFPQTYHVEINLKPIKNTITFSQGTQYTQKLYIPIPSTNDYHVVSNLKYSTGVLKNFNNSTERYLYLESQMPIEKVNISFDLKVYEILIDFTKIIENYPYKKAENSYRLLTQRENALIDPNNKRIKIISDGIWKESSDTLDYAKKIYAYVQKTIKWQEGEYQDLDTVFKRKWGDCGAFSSILVSLLRAKGIPSRYLTGGVIRKELNFENHMWCEFYLEKYGWIPIDGAFFGGNTYPYFGYEDNMRIFYNRGSHFETEDGQQIQALQTYAFYHGYKNGSMKGEYQLSKEVKIKLIEESEKAKVYSLKEFKNSLREKFLVLINQERKNLKLLTLKSVEKTNEIADEMALLSKENKKADIKKIMENKRYEINYYAHYYCGFPAYGLYPENQVFESLKKTFSNEKMKEIGIGLEYLKEKDQFLFYVFMASPKD